MSTQPPPNRTFLPVPLETTLRSHKHSNEPLTPPESSVGFDGIDDFKHNPADQSGHIESTHDASPPLRVRNLPQPIETSRRSHRVVESAIQSDQFYSFTSSIPLNTTEFDRQEITQAQDDASTPKALHPAVAQPPRSSTNTLLKPLELVAETRPRFTPQLMETTRRSRRAVPQYSGPVNNEAAPIPSDTSDTTITPTKKAAVVPHHKLTIWTPPEVQQAPPHRPQRPKARPLDGRSDLLTPDASRASSLPPPLRPYRQGSMRPHLNTRTNTRAGSNTDNSTPTCTPDIVVHGFSGDKKLFSDADDEPWDTPYPTTSSSDRPRYDSYSSTPSLSGSYDSSSQSQSDTQWMNNLSNSQHLARTRESCDERYSGYLLSLAAVEAAAQLSEKTLREQVESSFPNRDFCYEPVSHWGPGDDESSRAGTQSSKDFSVTHAENKDEDASLRLRVLETEESDEESDDGFEGPPPLEHEMLGRKESAQAKHVVDLGNGLILGGSDLPQEAGMTLEQILAHEAELVRLRAEETFRLVAEEATKPSFVDPFWTNGTSKKIVDAAAALNRADEKKREQELKIMQEAARPPLVGDDVVFRMCPSPKRTKNLDTNHKHAANIPKATNGGGLWGGYCVPDDRTEEEKRPRFLETPLDTPFNECADYSGGQGFLPLTDRFESSRSHPSHSRMTSGGVNILNEKLKAEVAKARREDKIQEEFNDRFVTQVYNYLSLGWPLLAREYDEELSHISHISENELRSNDDDNAAVGNIGLQRVSWAESDENGSVNQAGQKENEHISNIPRWRALKRYIHEWARQHPDLEGEGQSHRNWGDEASRRKGSWAI